MKKILIACEHSQTVCKEMRKLGLNSFSCDIIPCSGGHPEWHIQKDVLTILNDGWDLIISFPPCTDICVSGARYFKQKILDGRQQKAIDFFMEFVNADCPRIAIENPVGIMSSVYRKPDQIIQPWYFGDDASKATCLWLKNLPILKYTNVLPGDKKTRRGNQTISGQNKLGPSADRAKIRGITYPGIAKAMAEQWGFLVK